ncbi:MAG: hypothetical protein JHC95_00425 [Solirubrobacteraceae bacterium]|nr:hypothetical protein [Solirubrobacteraceae bacterium]
MPVADLPFDLVDVKLAAPQARPGTVTKADLIARLSSSGGRLVTVIAPAGYGKTTLLAKWAEIDPRPFAWVALDGQHDDAVVFLRYVAAAVHRVEPLPVEVFTALSGPGISTWSTRITRLGSALSAIDQPFVLVLDDLHVLTNSSCLDALAALFEYLPAGAQLAIASREESALPVGRWRAHGLTDEVGVVDLQLDEREAGQLLQAAGLDLEEDDVSHLAERTEGWPAGLYLAALSLRAGAPSPDSFTGDDRFVADYFRSELLSRLPPDEAAFLKRTSVLHRLCGGLCDAVLETPRSAETLHALERANGFVVALDRRDEWYRYHHLFRELLRNELDRTEPELARALNRRAMEWCIAHELHEAAIFYGHAAGETDTVAGLVDALALPHYFDGRLETLEEWLSWFDEDALAQYPALAVAGGWIRALTGRPAEAERWLSIADGATSRIPLSDGCETIAPWVANLRACMMPAGIEQAIRDADVALAGYPADSAWRPTALVVRGSAHALNGAVELAIADLTATVEEGRVLGSVDTVHFAISELALLAARQGQWAEAARYARDAQELVEETGLGGYSTSALAYVAAARVALHEGRKDDARLAIARAHRLRPLLDHGIPWLTVQVGLELARSHLALADPGAARTILTETDAVLARRPDLGLLVDDARELRERIAASADPAGTWAMSLTGAELRLLPYLATHLTFPEIATRLFISRNTVKTEAVSIYRKFGASSRSEAIARAIEVGLLESSIYPPRADLTLDG